MLNNQNEIFEQLMTHMKEMVRLYRYLLDIVRKEKDYLIESDLDALNNNNKAKELTLLKLKKYEEERIQCVEEFSKAIGYRKEPVRLLDLANELGGEQGESLRQQHSVLKLLLGRVQNLNKENEVFVQSALENVTGAMKSIKGELNENKVYKNKGHVKEQGEFAGRLVRRQV